MMQVIGEPLNKDQLIAEINRLTIYQREHERMLVSFYKQHEQIQTLTAQLNAALRRIEELSPAPAVPESRAAG